eukprot:7369835-Lingulodinium_polyedra.AAC.1
MANAGRPNPTANARVCLRARVVLMGWTRAPYLARTALCAVVDGGGRAAGRVAHLQRAGPTTAVAIAAPRPRGCA